MMNVGLLVSLAVLVAAPTPHTDRRTAPDDSMTWVQKTLEENSRITDRSSDGKRDQEFSTSLKKGTEPGQWILVYQRTENFRDTADSREYRQVIEYTFSPADLDPESVEAHKWTTPYSEKTLWMIQAKTTGEDIYIPYTNVYESIKSDGKPKLSTSSSKLRILVLGYFHDEDLARKVAKVFARIVQRSTRP